MSLHEPAKARIIDGTFSGEHFCNLLQEMVEEAKQADSDSYHLCVTYIEEGDEFVPGTYVPEIHLIVRKVDDELPRDQK